MSDQSLTIDAAVGAVLHGDAAEPRVVRERKVRLVLGDVAAPFALQLVAVEPLAVDVEREGVAAILGRPVVAQVDHAAAVGVAAAGVAVGSLPAARGGPVPAGPVLVVGAAFDQAVDCAD